MNEKKNLFSSCIINSFTGDTMGDKSPKSKAKDQKQKDSSKVKADQKAQNQKDARDANSAKLKK